MSAAESIEPIDIQFGQAQPLANRPTARASTHSIYFKRYLKQSETILKIAYKQMLH